MPLAASGPAEALRQRLATLGPNDRVFVVLRDIHAAAQPGVVYKVYFGLPPDAPHAESDTAPAGLLNFYGIAQPNPGRGISRSYDVTDIARQLAAQGLPPDRLAVTVVADAQQAPDAAARPTIGAIDLMIQ